MKKLNVSEYLTGRDPKKYFNEVHNSTIKNMTKFLRKLETIG